MNQDGWRYYADGHVQLLLDLHGERRKGRWRLLQQLSPHVIVPVAWTNGGEQTNRPTNGPRN